MPNQNEEVKDIEEVEIDSTEEVEPEDEEKETPTESSSEEEPDEQQEAVVDHTKEPKPVEGETPKEKALRLEVQRLRKERRQERASEISTETPKMKEEQDPEVDSVLSKYDPDELKNLEEVVDVIAKKKGWMRKDEQFAQTYTEKANEIKDEFLAEHPEYLPENDKDDTLWNAFKREFEMYKKPENPKDLKKILNRVHKEVYGGKDIDMAKISAKQEKLRSHAGTTQGGTLVRSTSNPALREQLKGFSEEELDELLED